MSYQGPTGLDQPHSPPPPPAPQLPPPGAERPTSPLAVAGLVLAFLMPLVGLVLSLVALGQTGPGKKAGRGFAVAGAIIGAVLTVLGVAILVISLIVINRTADAVSDDLNELEESLGDIPGAGNEEPGEPAGGIGDPVVDGALTFTVTRVENLGATFGEESDQVTASGEFVAVYVEVRNTGDAGRVFDGISQVAFDGEGTGYGASLSAYWLSDYPLPATLDPGEAIDEVPVVFDVPAGTTLDRINLHEVFASHGVTVSLQ